MKGSRFLKLLTFFGVFASLAMMTYFMTSSTSNERERRRELISLSSSDKTIQPGLRFQKVSSVNVPETDGDGDGDGVTGAVTEKAEETDGDVGVTTEAVKPIPDDVAPTVTESAKTSSTGTSTSSSSDTPKKTSDGSTQTGPTKKDASTQTVDQTPFFWTCPGVNDGKNFDRIRKDYNDLTEQERQLYIKALQKAYDEGHYSLFVNLHATHQNEYYAHSLASFFAWHRKYLLEFENMLRSLGEEFKCVTIPFWDWAQEARVCGKIRSGTESSSDEVHNSDGETCESFASVSHIVQDFGGGGEMGTITESDCRDEFRRTSGCRPSSVGCITQGPFKDWKDHFGRKCVVRHTEDQFQQEGMMAGTAAIDKVMHKESTLNDFYYSLYGFGHGATHMMVGGHMGNMLSPTDPLFWSHHCFVDKVWAVWQDCKDAHENLDDVMFTSRMQREKNMPFCMTVRPGREWSGSTFDGWLEGDVKSKAEAAAANDTDSFSGSDSPRHTCWGNDVTRVTSELVPGWNDKYMPKDFSDTHNIGVDGSNVLYWPDDYDRKTIFLKNSFCNFTKWSVCDYVRSGGDGSMEIDGTTLAERCGLAMSDVEEDYEEPDTRTASTNTETNTVESGTSTEVDDGDTALSFLEIGHSRASEALKAHHATMWTPQQTDSVGAKLSQSAEEDVNMFSEWLDTKVTEDLETQGKTVESCTPEEKEASVQHVMGDVLTKLAEHECSVLGSNHVEIQERFEQLKVWFGPEVLKANVKRCVLRPGQCNMVSWCKHLQLQRQCTPPEDADTPSTCTGACDSKTTHADCEAESTCTWIGMEGEPGRCL